MALGLESGVRRPAALPDFGTGAGMLSMAAAMLLLPVGDTLAKLLTREIDPLAVVLWRLLAQAAVLLGAAALLRRRLRGPALSAPAALSGCLVAITLASLVAAFAVMPIATAIAIFFVEPLLLTLLAGPLLGERPGPRQLAAAGVGLAGALIVIRPGAADFGPAAALPLVAATSYALNMIVMRRAGRTHSALTLQCGATLAAAAATGLVAGALALSGRLEIVPAAMPGWAWGAIAGSGLCAALSFVLIAEAFRRVEASRLAPLQYLEILGATALGYLAFRDFPDATTWLGVAVILASGLYVIRAGRPTGAAPRP